MHEQLRILIVDDSALVRRVLRELLESDPEICVVGEAANGREALLRAAELRPDVITMDVRMPVMDGLETTEQLMAYNPTPVLAITTLYSRDDVDISFKMLGSGALEVMEKPDLSDQGALERARRELIRRVKLLSRVRVVTHLRGRRRPDAESSGEAEAWRVKRSRKPLPPESSTPAVSKPAVSLPPEKSFEELKSVTPSPYRFPLYTPGSTSGVAAPARQREPDKPVSSSRLTKAAFPLVVIGASTGGPRVIQQILKALPRSFGAALLVVQHIAEGFSEGMVEWLSSSCALPVRMAQEGDTIALDTVLVAPDGFHLFVQEKGVVHLDDQPMLQRPSVDITMQTAAEVFGAWTIGVLLTGMGRDGAVGMQTIHLAGGYTIAQDEASCSIYGMPRAAVELNVVDEIASPEAIVPAIQRRLSP
jgi:two-component system chemotaxis response regulator CheB